MSAEFSRRKFLAGIAVGGTAGVEFLKALPNRAEAANVRDLQTPIQYDSSAQTWHLHSGPVEYRLGQDEDIIYLKYFGPAHQPDWASKAKPSGLPGHAHYRYDIDGLAEGQSLRPENLKLISHKIQHRGEGVDELAVVYVHRKLPFEIAAHYTTWGTTGVITRRLVVQNKSSRPLRIKDLPSLAWELPPGKYDLTYLWGGWAHERQVANEQLGPGRRAFAMTRGRSTNGYSPWFCLHHQELGVRYLAQLAYSGNWHMYFEDYPDGDSLEVENLRVLLGMRFDFDGPLQLAPEESFSLPEVAFTATAGDMDDGANQLHRYQRQYVIPRTPAINPLLVQFNTWYPFPGEMNIQQMKRCADIAAPLGRMFTLKLQ